MPVLSILPNGGTLSSGHVPGDHERVKRGVTQGWTNRVSRANRGFLWSVLSDQLDGAGFALSLTVNQCPESADQWQRSRRAFCKRLQRAGALRVHWLTEWQRRGVPHLHAAVWFPSGLDLTDPVDPTTSGGWIVRQWLDVCENYHARVQGQHVVPITGVTGWFQYLAKHAARGVHSYQRARYSIPAGWTKTGRMWGHLGQWPRLPETQVVVNWAGFWRLRRLLLRSEIADARSRSDFRRVAYLRRYLKREQDVSTQRAVSSWTSSDKHLRLVKAAASFCDVRLY